jgi:hypothetical protein
VASGKLNARWVVDKFHGSLILNFCFKVDGVVVHVLDIPFMYPYEADDML